MGIVVNTNSTAMYSNMFLSRANEGVKESMQKLSSGSRITSAKDDAAGLGISNQLTALKRGLGVAVRNGNDALSISQVAEGAMVEQTEMLLRMRDLALQAANGSNGEEQRLALDAEMQQLQVELTRIADTTTFGTEKLLNGFFEEKAFQVGPNAWEHLYVDIDNSSASAMGFKYFKTNQDELTIVGSTEVSEVGGIKNVRTLEVQVNDNTYKIDLEYAMTAQELEDKINSIRGISDISVDLLKGTGTERANINSGLEDANIYKQMGLNIDKFFGSGAAGDNMVLSFEVYNEFTKEMDEYDFNVDLSGVTSTDTQTLTHAVRDAINLVERKGFSQASGDEALRGLRAGVIGDAIVLEFKASEKYKQPVSFVAMEGGAKGLQFELLTDEEAWSSTGTKTPFATFDGVKKTFSRQTFEKQTALEAQKQLIRGELGEPDLMPLEPALPGLRSAVVINELKLTADYGDLVDGDDLEFTVKVNDTALDDTVDVTIATTDDFNTALFKALEGQVLATDFGGGAGDVKLGGDENGFYLADSTGTTQLAGPFKLEIELTKLEAQGTGTVVESDQSFLIAVEDMESQYAEADIVFDRPDTDNDATPSSPPSIALTAAATTVKNPVANIDPYDPNAGVAGGNNKYFDFKYASSFDINVDVTPKGAGADYVDGDKIAFKFDVVNASAASGAASLGSVEVEVVLDNLATNTVDKQIQEAIQAGLSGMQSTDKTVAFSMDDQGEFLIHTTDENATFKLLGEMTEHTINSNDADSNVGAGDAQFSVDVQLQLPSTTRATSTNTLTSTDRSQTLSTIANNVARVSAPQYRGSNWAGFTVGDVAFNSPSSPSPYAVAMSFDVKDAEGNTHTFQSDVTIDTDAATSATAIAATFGSVDSDKGVKLADLNMSIVADGDAFVIGYKQPDSDTPESVQVSNLAVVDSTVAAANTGDTFSLTGLSGTASYARTTMVYTGQTTDISDNSKYTLFDNRMSEPVDTDFVPANFVLDFDNFKVEEYVSSVAFKIDEKSFRMQADIELSEALYFNSVAAVNIRTFEATQEALAAIDAAMNSISSVRADLGAIQNRVVHTGKNNTNIQVQVAEANSRILDLDYAEESTQLAKVQVLQQTSASMLTQANQITQLAVQLVQG